jgi:outer membrane protein assembly factor BamB
MNSIMRLTGLLGVGALIVFLGNLNGQDWPQWRGANRDAKASGFSAPGTWPTNLTKKWSLKVGDGVATPSLVGDRLFVFARDGNKEVLRCLNAADGKEVWQDGYEARAADGPASGFAGPRCSPTVSDGKVVTLGVRGSLRCYDATTGKKLWQKDEVKTVPRFYTSSSPIVVDGTCIAQLGGESEGTVLAVDLATGDVKWKWSEDGTAYASPVLMTFAGTKVLIVEGSRAVVVLSLADGKQLWQTEYTVTGRGYNAATPMVDGQTVIITGSNRGARAFALEKDGDKLVGKELWKSPENSVMYNTPILRDGHLFGLTATDSFFCLDTKSGKTTWTTPAPKASPKGPPKGPPMGGAGGRPKGMMFGGGGYGSIVDAGSVLAGLTPAGTLVFFEASGKEYKQLASYKVADGGTYAYPILAGKRIFIKDRDSVTLWELE